MLEYEGYSSESAVLAADSISADWNFQAAMIAKHYLEVMPCSREKLIRQLRYEGFTEEEVEYGVTFVGY